MLLRLIFGSDIFISYSRKDGKQYATKLKEQLQSMDYSCFIDYEKVYAGDALNRSLWYAIRRSSVFVLVGTPKARESPFVRLEIDGCLKAERTLIPINIKGALTNPPWDVIQSSDLVWVDEPNGEVPSPDIYSELKRLFGFKRRNMRMRAGALAVILGLLALSGTAFWEARKAKQQQALAEDRQRSAQSGELASWARAQLNGDPELGLLLAIEAVERKPTPQAELALKQLLAEAHLKKVLPQKIGQGAKIAVSQDGNWIAAGDYPISGSQLWNTAWDKGLQVETEISESIGPDGLTVRLVAAFGPDDALLFSDGRVVKKFRLDASGLKTSEAGEEIKLSGQEGEISSCSFSPDGTLIATAGLNGTTRVWEAATGRNLYTLKGHKGRVFRGEFSSNGGHLVTAGEDRTARIWDLKTGKPAGVLQVELERFTPIAVSRDAQFVVIGYQSPQLWRNERKGWAADKLTFEGHEDRVWSVAFSSYGNYLVTASEDRTARIWDVGDVAELTVLRGHASGVSSAVFTPDDKSIITLSNDSTLRLWDAATGTEGVTLRESLGIDDDVRVSPNVELAVVLNNGAAQLLEIGTKRKIAEFQVYEGRLSETVFSPDSKLLVTREEKSAALVREADSGRILFKLEGLDDREYRIYFSPDGRYIIASDSKRIHGGQVWESSTGKFLYAFDGGEAPVYSPDGRLVVRLGVTKDENQYSRRHELWDISADKKVGDLSDAGYTTGLDTFSPDSKYLATVGKSVQVLDTRTLKTISVIEKEKLPYMVKGIRFSPDGKFIAVIDSQIRIFESQTARPVNVLGKSNLYRFNEAVFSLDNKYLISNGVGGVSLWDISAGITITRLKFYSPHITYASFSPDDKQLTLRGGEGSEQVFECELCGSVQKLVEIARRRVTRRLTEEERARYVPNL